MHTIRMLIDRVHKLSCDISALFTIKRISRLHDSPMVNK